MPSPSWRASRDFSSATRTLKVFYLYYFYLNKFQSWVSFSLSLICFFLSCVRACVCARAGGGVHEHWRAVPARGRLHAPHPSHHHRHPPLASPTPLPPPRPALVILTDTDARIAAVSPRTKAKACRLQVRTSWRMFCRRWRRRPSPRRRRRRRKAAEIARAARDREPPERCVCCVLLSRFILKCGYCGHCFGNSPTWVRNHPPENRHNKIKSLSVKSCCVFMKTLQWEINKKKSNCIILSGIY